MEIIMSFEIQQEYFFPKKLSCKTIVEIVIIMYFDYFLYYNLRYQFHSIIRYAPLTFTFPLLACLPACMYFSIQRCWSCWVYMTNICCSKGSRPFPFFLYLSVRTWHYLLHDTQITQPKGACILSSLSFRDSSLAHFYMLVFCIIISFVHLIRIINVCVHM